MKSLQHLQNEKEEKFNHLVIEHSVFFAFNNKQFEESKPKLEQNDEFYLLFVGTFCPKSKAKSFLNKMIELDHWFYEQIQLNKLREKYIEDQLSNYEAYYTGDLQDTLEALGENYTIEEIRKVYNSSKYLHE